MIMSPTYRSANVKRVPEIDSAVPVDRDRVGSRADTEFSA